MLECALLTNQKELEFSKFNLRYIHGEKYRPNIPYKYITEDGLEYINTAIPTKYMITEGKPEHEPQAILDLIFNLVGENIKYRHYFINWVAFCFVLGIKPQVAVILFGSEGTGKGIFCSIMSKLYGEDNFSQINASSFKSHYNLASYFYNKRFVNFDEITMSMSSRYESLLKTIVTNDYINLGEKVKIHFQSLFTANYSTVFQISESDRRYTVFNTGEKLTNNNFLGYGSYNILESHINNELEDFAKYLKSYPIDIELANTVLNTPQRELIINQSKTYIKDFHNALVNLDISYFKKVENINYSLYREVSLQMVQSKRFDRAKLASLYNIMYGDKISTASLMAQMRVINKTGTFDEKNIKHSGNNHYIHP